MAGENRTAKTAITISTAAAITAALALFTGKAKAAVGNGQIPEELWNLIIAIAKSADNIDADMDTLISKLGEAGITVQGWPENCNAIQTVRIICTVANQAYQLPDMDIPDGFQLLVKAWPLNAGLIYVGEDQSAATNPNRIFALNRSETVGIAIVSGNVAWVSATVAGDSVCLICEKRKAV